MSHSVLMRVSIVICLMCGVLQAQAQLFKTKKERQAKIIVAAPIDTDEPKRKFAFRCFSLGGKIEKTQVETCAQSRGMNIITDMMYYEKGENIRLQDKTTAYVNLSFQDDTDKLITIDIEDINDVNTVHQLQQSVLSQMGEPTRGYELMKNYDGLQGEVYADYVVYEFVYQYRIGANVYDFRATQFGAKYEGGRLIRPYTFAATINSESELGGSEATEDEKKKIDSFYPVEGVKNIQDFTVELKLLKKW